MPCASCCGSQADERSSFAEPSCRAHGYAATTAGGQLLFETPALRGAGDGPLAERIAGFLPNGYFFRCAHSLLRADRSVGLDPELYQLSRAYPSGESGEFNHAAMRLARY